MLVRRSYPKQIYLDCGLDCLDVGRDIAESEVGGESAILDL